MAREYETGFLTSRDKTALSFLLSFAASVSVWARLRWAGSAGRLFLLIVRALVDVSGHKGMVDS